MRCDQLRRRSPTRVSPASICCSSSEVMMPAAARARACACEAATSWGSRRQSKGKLRCHCSKVRSRGSRKRPAHILVACELFLVLVISNLLGSRPVFLQDSYYDRGGSHRGDEANEIRMIAQEVLQRSILTPSQNF